MKGDEGSVKAKECSLFLSLSISTMKLNIAAHYLLNPTGLSLHLANITLNSPSSPNSSVTDDSETSSLMDIDDNDTDDT